jgi:hypothetical protein
LKKKFYFKDPATFKMNKWRKIKEDYVRIARPTIAIKDVFGFTVPHLMKMRPAQTSPAISAFTLVLLECLEHDEQSDESQKLILYLYLRHASFQGMLLFSLLENLKSNFDVVNIDHFLADCRMNCTQKTIDAIQRSNDLYYNHAPSLLEIRNYKQSHDPKMRNARYFRWSQILAPGSMDGLGLKQNDALVIIIQTMIAQADDPYGPPGSSNVMAIQGIKLPQNVKEHCRNLALKCAMKYAHTVGK